MAKAEITANSSRFATRDKLVIEYSGPTRPHLTLVDLPGLVKNENTVQSASDIEAIEALTDHYMKSSRTVILAVVGGSIDYAQATILKKVRQYDPDGSRTIGVLTKPDTAIKEGLDGFFLELVNNKDRHNQMKLGWHVLLNPGPRETWTKEMRAAKEEEFFSEGTFSSLPPAMTRAASLRSKLSIQLTRHISRYIPKLRSQVQGTLDTREATRQLLGEGRDTIDEMREDLVNLLNEIKDIAGNAVSGNYGNEIGGSFFPREKEKTIPVQNLRARIVKENAIFAEKLRTNGHFLDFVSDSSAFAGFWDNAETKKSKYAETDVADLIEQTVGVHLPGERNHRIAFFLFQGHSRRWHTLAKDHIGSITTICNQFLTKVLEERCPEQKRTALRKYFMDPKMTQHHVEADEELSRLSRDLKFEVQPFDPEYLTRLDKWRNDRQQSTTDDDGQPQVVGYTEPELVLEQSLILYDVSKKPTV